MQLSVIAYARNGFVDKFGIPRQTTADTHLLTRIVFEPSYRVQEALRGIESFSHLWLLWGFHDLKRASGWKPTVRPPRLGGNRRVGVFATRSPYRPNPIGLSSVRLVRVEQTPTEGCVLVVTGADMLDGTPIYDIKPYLAYSDAHADAIDGFASDGYKRSLQVRWQTEPDGINEEDLSAIEEILSHDPRPAYQDDNQRVYHIRYRTYDIGFRVDKDIANVIGLDSIK